MADICAREGRPRLYVYDLPKKYRDMGRPAGQDYPPPMVHDGPPLVGFPDQVPLLNTGSLVLGGIFYKRAMNYICRTLDPANADL